MSSQRKRGQHPNAIFVSFLRPVGVRCTEHAEHEVVEGRLKIDERRGEGAESREGQVIMYERDMFISYPNQMPHDRSR